MKALLIILRLILVTLLPVLAVTARAADRTDSASGGTGLPDRPSHWAWQPLKRPPLPEVDNEMWRQNPIDRFVFAKLKARGIRPAEMAPKRTRIRRAYFDLVGLPPPPEKLKAYLSDGHFELGKLINELLASPHFGERWARHWLDLVRYAETLGHENDYPMPNAWRYRDYVVRAFNADVPYDRFVKEHLAGDLLPEPRRNPANGRNESIVGTAFYWFTQQTHSPVDVKAHQADLVSNQIDVLSKTFLGLTVSCARCHDHKFDPIPTEDFYALYGALTSSRYQQVPINSPSEVNDTIKQIQGIKKRIRRIVSDLWGRQWASIRDEIIESPSLLKEIQDRLDEDSVPSTPLRPEDERFADFSSGRVLGRWFLTGHILTDAQERLGYDYKPGSADRPVDRIVTGLHSGTVSSKLQGTLGSPTFVIEKPYIHIQASGADARVNLVVENFNVIRNPLYGGLRKKLTSKESEWLTLDVSMWEGQRAYLVLKDQTVADIAGPGSKEEAWFCLNQIVFSPHPNPPEGNGAQRPNWLAKRLASSVSIEDKGVTLAQIASRAIDAWRDGRLQDLPDGPYLAQLLNQLIEKSVLKLDSANRDRSDRTTTARLGRLFDRLKRLKGRIQRPIFVPSMSEGTPLDESVFVRGDHENRGEPVPRRFLSVLSEEKQEPLPNSSGRLAIAERMLAETNPLPARVMVNRVWHYLFGQGLVPTPDDFGRMGTPPTHPKLLDWLADWYRSEAKWSTKRLIRLIVTSRTYQMSTQPRDAMAERKDPGNRLLHRMRLRRLDAEAIRDAVLSVAGSLDDRLFGPPVSIHLTEFMNGHARPQESGPLDGNGRRSLYIEVRRNFLSPMMLAFDQPRPFTTVGDRNVSNVPAQGLILMNAPFVQQQARRWADRLLAADRGGNSIAERIRELYVKAFARPPSDRERSLSLDFLKEQSRAYGFELEQQPDDPRVWADLCHALLNVKEFIYLK